MMTRSLLFINTCSKLSSEYFYENLTACKEYSFGGVFVTSGSQSICDLNKGCCEWLVGAQRDKDNTCMAIFGSCKIKNSSLVAIFS